MGSHALWRDLGLWSRVDLTALMEANFPVLAAGNRRDMTWKTFLGEQLRQEVAIGTRHAAGGMH
jgi:nitrogen fixation protein NifQ